jgi:uncharacterized protein DUF1207
MAIRRPGNVLGMLVGLLAMAQSAAWAGTTEDAYIAGYAAAVMEREFDLKDAKVEVRDGRVTVVAEDVRGVDRDRLLNALRRIRGVVAVDVLKPGETAAAAPRGERELGRGEPGATQAEIKRPSSVFLPKDRLFTPLLADPRWPHFSVSYQYYRNDPELKDVGSTSFGETFPIYRSDLGPGQWDFGFQAAVFAIFDLDAQSKDLINADYWVGLPVTYRIGGFSLLTRLFHQSSHLGDEFLLRSRINRINLSYESVDVIASQEITRWLRVYAGGGYLFDQDPSDLKPWSSQGGVELESPIAFLDDHVRPIAGVDVQHREETDWDTDVSARGGLQLETAALKATKLQILGEYYNGHSPNGQFFERTIEFYGVGAHVHF